MIYELTDTRFVSCLYEGWEETMIWSCFQGIMGRIYADNPRAPRSAAAFIGDFVFFAGSPCAELAVFKPPDRTKKYALLIPRDSAWENMLLDIYGKRAHRIQRYATKKEPDIFDEKKLAQIAVSIPSGFHISLIDEPLYHQCRSASWCSDLVSQFPDYGHFHRLGLGVVVLFRDAVVSGASSYTRYRDGIEIEVDTREDCRRRGLASACAARLILECRKKHLYPSWDAHNQASLSLAQKLGYRYHYTYTAIEVPDY